MVFLLFYNSCCSLSLSLSLPLLLLRRSVGVLPALFFLFCHFPGKSTLKQTRPKFQHAVLDRRGNGGPILHATEPRIVGTCRADLLSLPVFGQLARGDVGDYEECHFLPFSIAPRGHSHSAPFSSLSLFPAGAAGFDSNWREPEGGAGKGGGEGGTGRERERGEERKKKTSCLSMCGLLNTSDLKCSCLKRWNFFFCTVLRAWLL